MENKVDICKQIDEAIKILKGDDEQRKQKALEWLKKIKSDSSIYLSEKQFNFVGTLIERYSKPKPKYNVNKGGYGEAINNLSLIIKQQQERIDYLTDLLLKNGIKV